MAETGKRRILPAGGGERGVLVAGSAPGCVADVADRLARELTRAGVENARREARDIVAALLDRPRHWPLTHGADAADLQLLARGLQAAKRRAAGVPFQYAVGRASFRRLTVEVDERVLIPRPETELLIDLVLEECGGDPGGIAVDVGTGSGAIALSLACEGHFGRVIGTDVSLDALAVASHNGATRRDVLGTPLEFRPGSLLAPVRGMGLRAVVSNPPYIAYEEAALLPRSVRDWEPAVALLSEGNGLAVTARLVAAAAAELEAEGLLALEVDARRASLVAEMVSADGRYADVSVRLDLAGRERFVVARRREEAGR